MAGAFTHFILCDTSKRKKSIIGPELYRLLNKHSQFLFLGAASPDLPYLSFKTGNINWADVMHYEHTNSLVISAYEELRSIWNKRTIADEIKMTWLFGYISHLIADSTIHPIVQAIVGPYELNKDEHRICEMTQDSLIFNLIKNLDITYSEFSEILNYCNKSDKYDELIAFWKYHVLKNYKDKNEEPYPGVWFNTYVKAVDLAEGGSGISALFRHTQFGSGYFYMPKDEIVNKFPNYYEKYFNKVKLPNGLIGSFLKDGFEKAVNNITLIWKEIYAGLKGDSEILASNLVKEWNLDTGEVINSPKKEVTFWA